MSNRVVHFEIHAENPERAISFYQQVFGWEFIKWEGSPDDYHMVMTAPKGSKDPGINGGLLKSSPLTPPAENCGTNAFVCTVQVDNYDETEKKILALGGKLVTSKTALANMDWQGYYRDPEGNTFGLHQADPEAK
jgi:predicted enzyme related to lactoylglutathione lyase